MYALKEQCRKRRDSIANIANASYLEVTIELLRQISTFVSEEQVAGTYGSWFGIAINDVQQNNTIILFVQQ